MSKLYFTGDKINTRGGKLACSCCAQFVRIKQVEYTIEADDVTGYTETIGGYGFHPNGCFCSFNERGDESFTFSDGNGNYQSVLREKFISDGVVASRLVTPEQLTEAEGYSDNSTQLRSLAKDWFWTFNAIGLYQSDYSANSEWNSCDGPCGDFESDSPANPIAGSYSISASLFAHADSKSRFFQQYGLYPQFNNGGSYDWVVGNGLDHKRETISLGTDTYLYYTEGSPPSFIPYLMAQNEFDSIDTYAKREYRSSPFHAKFYSRFHRNQAEFFREVYGGAISYIWEMNIVT